MVVNLGESIVSFMGVNVEEKVQFMQMFTFIEVDLQSCLKHLGLYLKPNDNTKRDWDWIISKAEKRLSLWFDRWLSGGRLVMVKLILEVIPIYWVSLSFISKGVL
jgi:hypothetical protein